MCCPPTREGPGYATDLLRMTEFCNFVPYNIQVFSIKIDRRVAVRYLLFVKNVLLLRHHEPLLSILSRPRLSQVFCNTEYTHYAYFELVLCHINDSQLAKLKKKKHFLIKFIG